MRGPPVVLTNTLGRPVTNVISERGAVPMTVVNTLGEPVTLVAQGGEPVTLFNPNGTLWDYPFSLFANNEQGAWYDPSDFSTLFQNSTGTTPVTAVEQPVRLMLDRSGRGNHATAPNDASRPVLRARYNLLEQSEVFDNAYWSKTRTSISANAAVAPNGTTTADKLIENTDTNTHTLFPNSALTLATTTGYTYSIYAKAAERTIIHLSTNDLVGAFFDLSAGTVSDIASGFTASITAAGSGWYRCVLTQTLNSNASGRLVVRLVSTGTTTSYTGDGTSGILIWGAQLLTSADQTSTGGAYQRIAAATDYDTSNPVWRPYLAFDGSDDSLSTSAIDFSGTDEMTVFAGVTKLSDANAAILLEASTNYSSNNGTFAVFAPAVGGQGRYYFYSRGTAEGAATSANTFAAPITNVVTALSDISGDSAVLRLNGTQAATSASDQGTGNFGNHALFIGRRNNSSLPFNGRLTSLIVLGRTATAAEISATESWVNGKTGGY